MWREHVSRIVAWERAKKELHRLQVNKAHDWDLTHARDAVDAAMAAVYAHKDDVGLDFTLMARFALETTEAGKKFQRRMRRLERQVAEMSNALAGALRHLNAGEGVPMSDRKKPKRGELEALASRLPGASVAVAVRRPAPASPSTSEPEIIFKRFAEIEPAEIAWLWPGRIPLGMLTIADGNAGEGKSLWSVDLAARLSRGWNMPPGPGNPFADPANVAFIAAEDPANSVIRPRLVAAGADLARCYFVEGLREKGVTQLLTLPDDNHFLEGFLRENAIRLVLIDPLMAYLAAKIDTNGDKDVRKALTPLTGMADRTGAAIVAVRHLNKGGTGDALSRGGGSVAIGAAARSVLFTGRHPTEADTKVLAVSKCNLTRKPPSLMYKIVTHDGWPAIDWLGECDLDANDLLQPVSRGDAGTRVSDAAAWLRDLLSKGPVPTKDISGKGERAGFAWRTIERASKEFTCYKYPSGFAGGWVWSLESGPNSGEEIP